MDRWDDLVAAVQSVLAGDHACEQIIVVIDHNDALLTRAQQHLPEAGSTVQVVANEHRQGLSGARNTAVALATEEVVAFLDDDATAAPSWLSRLLVHYEDPSVIGAGGSAVPVWPEAVTGSRPALLPAASPESRGEFDWVVGCTYQGQPESASRVRNLMGCNMSFRRSVFDSIGGFSEDLGRVGKTPLGGEETEFCIRARRARPGAAIVFEPAAVVRHRVSADRVRWRYLLSRCYSEGLSKALVAGMVGQEAALESERSYVTHVLTRGVLREAYKAVRGQRAGATGAAAICAGLAVTTAGYLRGALSRARSGRALTQKAPVVAG